MWILYVSCLLYGDYKGGRQRPKSEINPVIAIIQVGQLEWDVVKIYFYEMIDSTDYIMEQFQRKRIRSSVLITWNEFVMIYQD